MLCVAVTPTSRQLAKVDILNAARHAGLVEICVDHLAKGPDFADLFAAAGDVPVLISCRRPEEGGAWAGDEEARLALLRQAIVAGPAYVELDLETAGAIPRFGDVKRVVSHTLRRGVLANVDDIFARAKAAQADVVKFTWPTPTLGTAWPLLAAVAKKRDLPVVGLGHGAAGVTLSLLLRKYGSPWVYAALERGMEAFGGQPTVFELEDLYDFSKVERGTRFVGLTGFEPDGVIGEPTAELAAEMNAALAAGGHAARALPLVFGEESGRRKMLDALKLNAIVRGPHDEVFVDRPADGKETGPPADLLLRKKEGEGWSGRSVVGPAVTKALAAGEGGDLKRVQVLLLGADDARSRAVAASLTEVCGVLHVAGPDDVDARRLAEAAGGRFVPKRSIYETRVEAIVNTSPALRIGTSAGAISDALVKGGHAVLDVAEAEGVETGLTAVAAARGAKLVDAVAFRRGVIEAVVEKLTGRS